MADFSIHEMQEMQKALQEKYKEKWGGLSPGVGKNQLLWMIGEIGEVIDIIKKNGAQKAAADAALRKDLIEELTDVLMYYNDVLLCYDVTEEELKQAYIEKFQRNMTRW
jgi:NTP pyrophosphatase (non-canonical NTP hydrolase)